MVQDFEIGLWDWSAIGWINRVWLLHDNQNYPTRYPPLHFMTCISNIGLRVRISKKKKELLLYSARATEV